MKRFFVKPNFGHFSVIDRTTNKMVVGYSKKEYSEKTASGLNRLRTEKSIEKMIKTLQSLKGYGHYIQ